MALLYLVYRDKLFPRPEYHRAFEALCVTMPERPACKITVELLALAHERNCEAELASELGQVLRAGSLPDLAALRRRFSPDPADLPQVFVQPVCLDSYQVLVGTPDMAGERA